MDSRVAGLRRPGGRAIDRRRLGARARWALPLIAIAATLAGCYQAPVGEAASTGGPATATAGAVSTFTPGPSPTPTPELTPAPTETPAPTPAPTPKPTPAPTPRRTAAPLPWPAGASGSIDVPQDVYAGTTITFRIWDLPAPAKCTLRFTWPDASTVPLATKTATKGAPPSGSSYAYSASWSLDIPAAQVGEGKFTYVCTYLGVVRIDSWFTITIQPPVTLPG